MIRVLLVDDHRLMREGIAQLLVDAEHIAVVDAVDSGEQAIDRARTHSLDLVLMDLEMPGIGGLEATRKLTRSHEQLRVIALTAHEREPYPSRLLEAGALGYVTKGCGQAEMIKAIDRVYAGKRYISSEIAQRMALAGLDGAADSLFDRLSQREMQVMIMVTEGYRSQQISERLCLSPKTVSTYRCRVCEKLDVANDVELTHLAIRYRVISRES